MNLVQKLQNKSPLKYQIVRCLNCFVSKSLIQNREECADKFDKIVEIMHKKGHLATKEGEDDKYQSDDFNSNIAKENFELFSQFDWGKERLADFYEQWLNNLSSLWKVLIFSFVLPHAKSGIERGFNISDTLLVENLKTESLTPQRSVKDFKNASDCLMIEWRSIV